MTDSRRPLDRPLLVRAVAVAVLVAALAVVVAGQLWLRGQRAQDDRETEIREAAESAVTAVLSYDYRRLDEGVDDTRPLLTGDALAQYDEVQEPLRETAPRLEAVVSADVASATVLDFDEDTAQVLLFVDQLSSSRKLTEPQLDQSRVVVTMERDGAGWLVATLAAV